MSLIPRLPRGARNPAALLSLAAFGLCGSGPVPKGSEVSGGVGAGRRHYQTGGGCAGAIVDHDAIEYGGHVAANHGFDNGWTLSAGASTAANDPVRTGDRREVGQLSNLNTRAGYDFEYGGLQAGPSLWIISNEDGVEAAPLFSASTWIGERSLFLYGNLLTGPMSLVASPVGVGLGHQGEDLRLEVGVAVGNIDAHESCPALHLDGRYRVEHLWLGVGADGCNTETVRGVVNVGYAFGD